MPWTRRSWTMDAGAIQDVSGNQNDAASDYTITKTVIVPSDTTPPAISSASYNATDGTLTISFSEAIDSSTYDASKIHVRDSGQDTGGVTLSNDDITSSGDSDSITFDLGDADTVSINAMGTPQIDLDAGAIQDVSGNQNDAASDYTITKTVIVPSDTTPPAISSASYNATDGTLTISFSEAHRHIDI